jgi:hypothetical protein
MKKVLAFLSIIAMMGLVSCKKEPVAATITANDVTVEEGATAKISASTNSTASITYASADASIAVVSAAGDVTGIKAGTTTVTLKVAAVEGFSAAEKTINVTVTAKEVVPPTPSGSAIKIDGDFADWGALETGTFTKSVSDPDAPWDAVKEVRCYADADFVFYYIKYDAESLEELLSNANETLPIRLNFNTDGEFESGYTSYFLEHYDLIIEGSLASAGQFAPYVEGEFNQRIGSWVKLADAGVGLVTGLGSGNEYEIQVDRALFNQFANASTIPMPMGDEFQTSVRFYTDGGGKWEELSNIPNSSIDEEAGNGYGYLMRIKTNK